MQSSMSLKFFAILALTMNSASLIQAYNCTHKYADKQTKKHAVCDRKNKNSYAYAKKTMKKIKHELRTIQQAFDRNYDEKVAHQALDNLAMKIEKIVATMKENEKRGRMWQVHEHTLYRKLDAVRNHVCQETHKNS